MKRLISTLAIFAGMMAYSQVTFGLRANALLDTSSASWENFKGAVNSAVETKGNNSTGFNVGLAAKVDFPVSGWFVMPEIYYTSFKKSVQTSGDVEIEAKSNRIDVPVLLGHNFLLGKLAAFVGPVASYNLSGDKTYEDFKVNAKNEFTVGYQFGAQATLSKFVLNARYEGAFSKDSRNVIDIASGDTVIRYDNRPSMFIVGIGYNFN
ncbi:porin family protein [Epilithonimonas tenax]|uniref:outer membrane beta-barrel protein n=1 Tax=Epilithonimonas tenax TaxID=191577 RepID=UPI000488D7FD|nr:outer membrane beta-barrel protein [Epilithonimonas tenax]